MNDTAQHAGRPAQWIGPILFVLALAVYAVTLTPGPHPGESARLGAQVLGLDPFISALYPLWYLLAGLIAWLNPLGSVTLSMNFLSALLSALSVWLIYSVVSRLPQLKVELVKDEPPSKQPGRVAGVAAALLFAFCVPFWMTATQTHHLPLEIALLLGAGLLFLQYVHKEDMRWLYAFVVYYGVGAVESVLFIVSAPLFAAYLVVLLALREQLRVKVVGKLVLLFLVGLTFYFYAAWRFYSAPVYEWHDYTHFLQIIWFMWVEQYAIMRHGLGQVGWLIVFMTAILPFLIVLATPRLLSSRQAVKIGPLLLHVTLTVLAVLLLFNARVAPWVATGRTNLMVFPYLLWAIYGGYLVGYWYVILCGRYASRSSRPMLRRLRPVWIGAVIAAIGVAAFLNWQQVSHKGIRNVHVFLDEVLESLDGRDWFLSNGVLDHSLMLMAHERDQSVEVMNPRLARNPLYLRYLSSLFDDPHLQSLASVGLIPLLTEWVEIDEDIHERLAILHWDEFWASHGFYPVPDGVLFVGARVAAEIDTDDLYDRNMVFWERWLERTEDAPEGTGLFAEFMRWQRGHVSRVANNFGVMLEELDEPEKAYESYRKARAINPDNVSALLNMASLAYRHDYPEADELNQTVDELAALPDHELRHWSLVARYGTVRHPEAYARRGMAWAMSGKADVAIADIQRAIEAGAEGEQLSFVLASLYFEDEQFDESERMYSDMLREDPDNPGALMGLSRVAVRRGNFDLARGYIERLKELGVDSVRVGLEEAALEILDGREDRGRRVLEKLVEDQPGLTRAWAMLVLVALAQEDEPLLTRALRALGESGTMDARSLMVVAHAQMSRGRLSEARNTLERIARMHPADMAVQEALLRLDVMERNQTDARRRVEAILSRDPRNAFANYILGTLHYNAGNMMLAESAFRTSVNHDPTAEALSDLAWVLQLRGEYDEAYEYIRRSIELETDNGISWNVYGVIMMHRDDLDGAEAALQRALDLLPDSPRIELNLARVYERQERYEEALTMVDRVQEQISLLSDEERRDALQLSSRLRRRL